MKAVDSVEDVSTPSRINGVDGDSRLNSVDPLQHRDSLCRQKYGSVSVDVETVHRGVRKKCPQKSLSCTALEWLCLCLLLTLTAAVFVTPVMFHYLYHTAVSDT